MAVVGVEPEGEGAATPGYFDDGGDLHDAGPRAAQAHRPHQRADSIGPHAAGQPMGEHLVDIVVGPPDQLLRWPVTGERLRDALGQQGGPWAWVGCFWRPAT